MYKNIIKRRWFIIKKVKHKAIKAVLYPNENQRTLIIKTTGCSRKIWNLMLDDAEKNFNKSGKIIIQTPATYKSDYPFLKEVDSLALANVYLNLQKAFKNHYNNSKFGFPKHKSYKHSRKSYTTNNQNGTIAIIDDKHIKLPKLGIVKAKVHRFPKEDWKLKSATITVKSSGKIEVSFLFEYEVDIDYVSIDSDKAIGLDYKSNGLYMDSNGHIATDSNKFFRKEQKKLAKLQQELSRKEYGSNNYYKVCQKIAKLHEHIANKRKDFLHKLSTEITNRYDIICVESLNMSALANRKFHNGKATLDNGYGIFINMLKYKQDDKGHYLVEIEKTFPSTQLCSKCGKQHKMLLSDRVYQCECGNILDRDLNSAINILNEGLRLLRETSFQSVG